MEIALAGGVAAYGSAAAGTVGAAGAGSAAGGTALGAALASNPVGWLIALVIAVIIVIALVIIYWDEICNFFSSVGNAIADTAKVVWEFVSSPAIPVPPPAIDEELPAPAPPSAIPGEEPITIPIAPPISIPTTKPRTRRREKNIYNVYDLHVGKAGFFRSYTFGMGFADVMLINGAIWKYGLTSFKSVYARYMVISQLYKSDKEEYIFNRLTSGKLVPYQWYLANVTYAAANTEEVRLIDTYAVKYGNFPPGNTFRG